MVLAGFEGAVALRCRLLPPLAALVVRVWVPVVVTAPAAVLALLARVSHVRRWFVGPLASVAPSLAAAIHLAQLRIRSRQPPHSAYSPPSPDSPFRSRSRRSSARFAALRPRRPRSCIPALRAPAMRQSSGARAVGFLPLRCRSPRRRPCRGWLGGRCRGGACC